MQYLELTQNRSFKDYLFAILCCLLSALSFGQLDDQTSFYDKELAKTIKAPASPESASFMKYGDVSVNMYTGTPSINIPLYSHQGIEMSLPISLDYDAQGIKVEEMASWTGLKFNLVAGGRISRIQNGEPDGFFVGNNINTFFTNDAFRTSSLDLFNTSEFSSPADVGLHFSLLEGLYNGRDDMFPDYYSINAPAMNGYATFDMGTMEMQCIDNSRTKVAYERGGTDNYISTITVTGEDGTVCVFGENGAYEVTERTSFNDIFDNNSGAGTTRFISSWLLTRIESPNKKDVYEFEYFDPVIWDQGFNPHPTTHVVNPYMQDPTVVFQNQIALVLGPEQFSNYSEEHKLEQRYLHRIKHNGRVIIENQLTPREDVPSTGLSALSNINIYDWCEGENLAGECTQELLRSISFDYSYFNVDPALGETPESKDYDEIRLKLDAVNFNGKDNVRYQQYRMEYENAKDLPTRRALSQDYLGFYNGKNNSVLYPAHTAGNGDFLAGADRSVDENLITTGMLKRLYYPTGGFTEFEFEAHRIKDGTTTVTTSESSSASGSGRPEDNCGSCCNDKFLPEGGAVVSSRIVSLSGTYQLTFNSTGTSECYLLPIVDASASVNYSQVCGASSAGYVIYNSSGAQLNQSVTFLGGTYQMITVTAATQGNLATLSLVKETQVPIPTLKAGVRVKQVTDFTKETTTPARVKTYNYINEDGTQSGIVVNDKKLVYNTNQTVFNQFLGSFYSIPTIHRLSDAGGAGEPHVAYPRIEEVISDSGKNVITYNVGNTGVMSGILPPYRNFYSTNLENANPITSKVYTEDNLLLSETSTEYFEGATRTLSGLEVARDDTKQYQYILVVDLGNGSFSYQLVDAIWKCAGTVDCGPLPVPPLVCEDPNNTCFDRRLAVFEKGGSLALGKLGGPSRVITTQYPDPSNPLKKIVTTSETIYDGSVDFLIRETKLTDSEGNVQSEVMQYPKDNIHPSHAKLVANNKLAIPVQSEQYETVNGTAQRTWLQQSTYQDDAFGNLAIDLPEFTYTAKNNDPLDLRILFKKFDDKGNLTEVEQESGVPTAYLWGYDQSRIIAKVDNAEFRKDGDNVITSTGAQAVTQALFEFTNGPDLQNLTGDALRAVLDQALRNNPKFSGMVTTYTHKPQVGITTMTDTRGYTIFYEYDEFLRLKAVRDADGHLLSKNEYNYQTQQ